MNLYVAQISFPDEEKLHVAEIKNVNLDRVSDVIQALIANEFSEVCSTINLTEMSWSLKQDGTYRCIMFPRDGNEVCFGFCTYGLFAAVGCATIAKHEANEEKIKVKGMSV